MSVSGHFQTWAREVARSALPLRTDVAGRACQVRKVPTADIPLEERRIFASGLPRNENGGSAFQHRLALLIAQQVSVADYSPVRFRFRGAQFQNRDFEIERVTRTYRVRQLQLFPTLLDQNLEVRLKLTDSRM